MKTLSIVIPVYNEKETLLGLLKSVEASDIGDLSKEIILIDDFSTDGSRELLEDLSKTGKYKILFHDENCGKGAALRLGFSRATGDYILVQDADLEYDPKEYSSLLLPLLLGKADVVYGSRFIGDMPHRVLFFWHYVGNKFLTLLSNIFTNLNLTDMETCYKAFSREALKKILPHLESNRFGIEPEITALVSENKLRIFEVGISYSGRTYEEGKKINWKDGLSAIWTIIKTKFRFSSFGKDIYKSTLLLLLVFISIFSIYALEPKIQGDSVSYMQSMEVLKTSVVPHDFTPNRVVSTYLGMEFIMHIGDLVGSVSFSWLFLNSILYIMMGIFFYSLLNKIVQNSRVAFIGTLFLTLNYSAVVFGLAYLLDIGGWMFYVASIYFSFRYLEKKKVDFLYLGSISIGLGGLWKEYAFFAYIVIFGVILWSEWKNWSKIATRILFTGLISFLPFFVLNLYVYSVYHYTYASWFAHQAIYVYKSRVVEYIKSFGSLYNFGWFLFLPGFYLLLKDSKKIFKDNKIFFIWLVLLSILPVFTWGAITQRVLFITVPALVLVSSLFIKKMDKWWYVAAPLLVVYILSSYLMDSYVLKVINVQPIINYFL